MGLRRVRQDAEDAARSMGVLRDITEEVGEAINSVERDAPPAPPTSISEAFRGAPVPLTGTGGGAGGTANGLISQASALDDLTRELRLQREESTRQSQQFTGLLGRLASSLDDNAGLVTRASGGDLA